MFLQISKRLHGETYLLDVDDFMVAFDRATVTLLLERLCNCDDRRYYLYPADNCEHLKQQDQVNRGTNYAGKHLKPAVGTGTNYGMYVDSNGVAGKHLRQARTDGLPSSGGQPEDQ